MFALTWFFFNKYHYKVLLHVTNSIKKVILRKKIWCGHVFKKISLIWLGIWHWHERFFWRSLKEGAIGILLTRILILHCMSVFTCQHIIFSFILSQKTFTPTLIYPIILPCDPFFKIILFYLWEKKRKKI